MTTDVSLSPSERRMLGTVAEGGEQEFMFDWVALQRLKSFGFVEDTPQGPKITAAGKRAMGRAQS